jgi:4-amino-4-deoxychorismate lyase
MKFFETIKVKDGKIFHLPYHQERFEKTSGLHVNLASYITPPQEGLLRVKLIYTNKEILEVHYFPYVKKTIRSVKLLPIDFDYEKKYLDRSNIDQAYQQRDNCDEILMLKNGYITDTSIANVAFFYNQEWITPKVPLLYGTTRKRYLESKKIKEKEITPQMVQHSSHIAFLNALVDFDIMSIENFTKDTIFVNKHH